jgi:hypothetical protein
MRAQGERKLVVQSLNKCYLWAQNNENTYLFEIDMKKSGCFLSMKVVLCMNHNMIDEEKLWNLDS